MRTSVIAHHLAQPAQAAQVFFVIVLAEFHQQDGVGFATHELFQRRPKHGDVTRQLNHRAVDQLHRNRT